MTKLEKFLQEKQSCGIDSGFDPLWIPDFLFDFQKSLVEWAIRKGRAAIFADCGMGKTPMQLVWSQNVIQKTNRPVLILTPLAVGVQTLDEAAKFSIEAIKAIPSNPSSVIQVINYEQLHKYDPGDYAGVVSDESSILKNFNGKRKSEITEFMRKIPYRLLCTATAAPNDWDELGTSSEALGYLGYMDMLGRFFTNKQSSTALRKGRFARQEKWRLRSYAAEGPFWQWVASWARAARKPSDLGFDDDGFILPPLNEKHNVVEAREATPGALWDIEAISFHEIQEAIRRTITERCEAAAEKTFSNSAVSVVWCNRNDEGDLLEQLIPDSVQVAGRHSDEYKIEAARWFVKDSGKRVLISKPSIFGFGLNFQHCHHMTYFPTYSYEQYYQATRRLWRFGQENQVVVDHVYTHGGQRMMKAIEEKAGYADEMFTNLVKYMNQSLSVESVYEKQEIELPQWIRDK